MMRKQPAILLSMVLFLFSVAGCSGGEEEAAVRTREETDTGASSIYGEAENEPVEGASPPVKAAEPEEAEMEPDTEDTANNWEFGEPEDYGMDGETLARLHSAVSGEEIYSIVTVKDRVIIDEYYKGDYDENSVFTLHSCSKTFTGALIGLAIDQGYISGVDAMLADYLPQLAAYPDGERKQQITIEHLLTHTSGLEWYEWGGNSSSWRPFREAENWVEHILSQNIVAQPGTYFAYSTGGSHLLAAALQEATGQSVLDYGHEAVFGPMGMDSVEWEVDEQGVIDGGNGIAMTARDAAKFGQLYLDGGRWRGEQILPEEWVNISLERRVPGADGTAAYGYQWWIRSCGAANYETYYAMGAGGQFIFVVPELDLVTVITSRSRDTYAPRAYFIDYILVAYVQEQEEA